MVKYKEIFRGAVGFIRGKVNMLIVTALLGVLGYIVADDMTFPKKEIIVKPEPLMKPITKEAKKEFCDSPQQYVIETNQLLQTGNFIVLDMDTFENFKTNRIDRDRMGYYYRRSTGANGEKQFITFFKHEPLITK